MILFERFIARANIEVSKFLEEVGIKSDEELANYCVEKNMSIPLQKYFSEEKEENIASETKVKVEKPKPKRAQQPKVKAKNPLSLDEKKAKPTRRRSRKKTEAQ